jgi:DNA-binding CsgD family transcriptional regulator
MFEIGAMLDISYKTVAAASASLRGKLKARTPAEMVRIALAMKIV